MKNVPLQIIFGTVTGNSEVLAEETATKLKEAGFPVELNTMEDISIKDLDRIETLLVIVSTDSGGSPPFMAVDLYKSLRDKTDADLQHLSYSVLALGDSYYLDFCQTGKDFDRMFEGLGACKIMERRDLDIDYWDDFYHWFDDILAALSKRKQTVTC